MASNSIFNVTVCIIGIAILLIHIVDVLLKKNRRRDEKRLLNFLCFTVIHFATYLTFTFVKTVYTSDAYVIAFYTIFYIFNNLEAFLLFLYILSYVEVNEKLKRSLSWFSIGLFSIFIILDIVNIFTHMFFTSINGEYTRANLMILSQGYQFVMFLLIFLIAVFNKNLVVREKVAFSLYCTLPFAAIILQNAFKGYAIAYASIVIAIEILFLFVNVQKNIRLAEEEEKNKNAQIRIMMSQIQPHFIYNSLSAISTLITIDPEKAQQTLDAFTEYLRHNLSALTQTNLIPFKDELRHIQTYVSLEKVRFNDRIEVEYDIQTTDFAVPPLSVQPIVENAIKHGVLKKIEGGKVIFRTYETDDAYVVEVKDDGAGFDLNSLDLSDNKHFGLNNIRHRLENMCNGELDLQSEVGKGTTAIITFYK